MNIKQLKLEELLVVAKTVNYIPPTNDLSKMTNDEIYDGCINVVVNNPIQMKGAMIVCSVFPPLKLLFKSSIRSYIERFYQQNQQQANLGV
jgi:hypothetical protein|tara:strand:- start:5 stop:277 length:273 start_codon:yes stop_codon:yes gene_type:complete